MARRKGLSVNGWLIFDKPEGMTSTQAVSRVKRLYQAAKAGHAGTLDPLATGVLPIAFGEATKTVPFAVEGSKGTGSQSASAPRPTPTTPRERRSREATGGRPAPRSRRGSRFHRRHRAGPAPLLRAQGRRRPRLRPRPRRGAVRARAAARVDPRIARLDSRDPTFRQLQQDIEAYYRADARGDASPRPSSRCSPTSACARTCSRSPRA